MSRLNQRATEHSWLINIVTLVDVLCMAHHTRCMSPKSAFDQNTVITAVSD